MATTTDMGQRIAAWRGRRGFTQSDLAAFVEGLDQSKLSRIEAGSRKVSSLELADLAAALGVDPLDLLEERPLSEALLVAARGATDPSCVARATRRSVDVLRSWRLLSSDGFAPDVGSRPDVQASGETVIAGDAAASELRAVLGLGDTPIDDLLEVAAKVGLLVSYAPYGSGLDGICSADGEGRAVAVVNSSHWGSRQRFTLAHEIAHWVLGDVDAGTVTDEDVYKASSAREVRANAFAAQLLVPDSVARSLSDPVEAIRCAYRYNVSVATMGWRVHNAGGNCTMAREIRSFPAWHAAEFADEHAKYELDSQARNRVGVSLAIEKAARRAFDAGALSESHLEELVPSAVGEPGGPS